MAQAEDLQEVMSSLMISKDAVKNAHDIEQALDKIAVARNRISEAKGLATNKDDVSALRKMDREIEKIQKRFESFGKADNDISKAMMGTKGMAQFLKLKDGLVIALDQIRRKTGEVTEQALADERAKAAEEKRVDTLKSKYYELLRVRKGLQDAIMSAAPGTDLTEAFSMLQGVQSRLGAIKKAEKNGSGMPSSVAGADGLEYLRRVDEKTRELTATTDAFNKKVSTTEGIYANLKRLELDTQSQQTIAGIRKQTTEYQTLAQKLQEISNLKNAVKAEQQGISNGTITKPTYTREYVNERLEAIQRRYNEAIARGKQQEKEDSEAKNQQAAASRKAADAIQLMAHANQGLISSYNRVAEAGNKVRGVNIQIQQQIGQYASLYGIERILKSVITIGGQFEVQHVALKNILGDLNQANSLFSQLQTLAVESPKTFMELTAYTKQLSAYQIPYEELYDTTKRLADMSTGLGVDMSRLILAYGQVRSASVLRGQELRQFTEAGIPLVEKLAEEFSKLNGKAVTTGDVFELISKRAVSFDMVKKILWDMTNEGGQFFNMQSELADTLYGKWQKLQDQWQISLGHIADGKGVVGGFFREILESLVGIAAAADTIMPMLGMFMGAKVGTKLFNGTREAIMNQTGASALNKMSLAKEKEANRLLRERIMYGRQLSAEESKIVLQKDKLVANDLRLLLLEEQITERQMMQQVNAGRLNWLEAMRALRAQGYTIEQLKQIRNGNLQILQGEKLIAKFSKGAWNFLGGGWGVALTALGGLMSLYGEASNKAEEAKTTATGATDALMNNVKGLSTLYDEMERKAPSSNEERANAVERITNALKEAGRYSDEFNQKVEAAGDNASKYSLLYNELKVVSEEYLHMKDNVELYLEAANKTGGGNKFTQMFNDPMSEDIKDWSEAVIEKKAAANGVAKYGKSIRRELEAYLKETNKWVESEMAGMDWQSLFEKVNKEWFVNRLKNDPTRDWSEAVDAINEYRDAMRDVYSQEQEVDGQMDDYINHLQTALDERAKFAQLDLSKLNQWEDKDLRQFSNWINDIVKSYNVDSETAEQLRDKILSRIAPKEVILKIKALPAPDNNALSSWQTELDNYFKAHKFNNQILVPIDAKTSLESVEKELQDKRKTWQEQMSRSKGILLKFGADFGNLEESIKALMKKYPFMSNVIQKAYDDHKEGKNGIAAIDQAGKDTGINVVKQTKSSGSGHKEDKTLKMWRKRIELLERYRKALEDLEKYMTRSDAESKLRENKNFNALWGYFGNPNDYNASINKAIGAMGKSPKGERKDFVDSLNVKKEEENMRKFENDTKATVEELQRMLNVMSENYDVYKKWLELTGDAKLAANVAGVAQNSSYSDLLTEEMKKALSEAKKDNSVEEVFGMKESEVSKFGKDNAIFKIWEEWQKNQQKVKKETLSAYEEAIKASKGYAEKIDDINRKLAEQVALIEKDPTLTQEGKDKAIGQLNKDANKKKAHETWENFKSNEDWGRIFANLDRVSSETINHMLTELEKVAPTINDDVESTKALYEAMEKLREQQESRNPFLSITNSLKDSARIKDYLKMAGMAVADKDMARILGVNKGSVVDMGSDKTKRKLKDAERNADKGFVNGIQAIEKNFKSLQMVLKPVIDLFDELGNKTLSDIFNAGSNALGSAANTASAISSVKGLFDEKSGIAKALGAAGPWGAAASAALSLATSAMGMFGADYREYNKMKEQYEGLISVWDDLIDRKKSYLSESWGTEAKNAGKEALSILQSEIDQTKVVAKGRLGAGSSWGSHSIGYRMWQGSYKYNGQNWRDVADSISKQFNGVKFNGMADMLDMTSEQLLWIKTNYSGLWATMDGDFREYLDKLIQYGDTETEIVDQLKEKLTGWDFEDVLSSWGNLLTTMSNGTDALADDLENKLKSAIVNSMMSNLYGEQVNGLIEKANKYAKNNDKIMQTDKVLSEYTAEEYQELMTEARQIAEDAKNSRDFLKEMFGWKDSGSSSSSTNIGKEITEQDSKLWSSYLNAMRLDLSVHRATLEKLMQEVLTHREMPEIAKAQLKQLDAIAENTKQNVKLVSQIYNLLHNVAPDGSAFKVK
ncbi:tape measure protein [Xylanibacter ruminicola]|nr:tape measure protein [Xylanibacter ruminicola]